jgi:hypothetical protein
MAQSSFNNFFNNSQGFGANIKVPEKTIEQIGKTGSNVAGKVFEPLFTYLEENENVFSGDITDEMNRLRAANFNTTLLMDIADEKVNGARPSFDAKF